MKDTAQQTQLESYLLGTLGDAEMEALEERHFTDDEAFLEMQSAEMALVDRYVRNEMSDAERESFEANYLVSPERDSKVDGARAFHNELADLQPSVVAEDLPVSWAERLRRAFLVPAMQFAGAALVLILAVSTGWLILERGRTQNELLQARQSEQELSQQLNDRQQELDRRVAEQRGEDSESLAALQNEIDDLQTKLDEANNRHVNQSNTPARRPLIATVFLSIGRGGVAAVPTVNVPHDVKVLNIKLPLTVDQSFPFDIEISTGGKTVFRKSVSQLPNGENPTVNLSLPTGSIVDGQCDVSIRDKNGETKTRSFIVTRERR